jgi:fluoroquinolone transport system permease protein
MKKYLILLSADFKNMGRDPMLILSSVAPILLLAVMRFGVPLASELLHTYTSFDLKEYYMLIALFLSLLPAMLWGFMTAFLSLDEHDNRISSYLFITPIRKTGYLCYRLSFPLVFSCTFTLIMLSLNGLAVFTSVEILFFAFFSSLLGLFFFLTLVTFAHNKVEGLALGKALGVVLLGPIASFILPVPLKYIGCIFPPFWSAELVVHLKSGAAVLDIILIMGTALCAHILPLIFLYKRYMRSLL